MGDEHLDTIPEKESDEFIKSSVENLVPNSSESEDERECDVPACDDFPTFSNLLFDVDNDFSSSNNESFSDDNIPKEIYSNPLFDEEIISIKIDPHHLNAKSDLIESLLNQDSSIISSSKIDSLLDEFVGMRSIYLLLRMTRCHRALKMITMTLKGIYLSPRTLAKPPDDDEIEPNSRILTVKVVGDISEHYVPMHRLLPTPPTLASNQEKSPHLLSHWGLKAF
uniref:Reverse transcriptase domain-containing protein n=1 Tax=Tanacetum cinerariifolium TaxID=118510 RepID=A0A6L2NX83_TANCI|nr:hypothetical protein [Tanacetum cinerariifolium]